MNTSLEKTIEACLLELLARRAPGKSICPSEVARALSPKSWRALMEPVRCVGVKLAQKGTIEITQRGEVVEGPTFVGPVRMRMKIR